MVADLADMRGGPQPPGRRGVVPAPPQTKGAFAMNWDQIEGKWKEYKGKVKQQWGNLTDDDLDRIDGRRDEVAGLIQQRYGKTKAEAERAVDDWLASS
jgi:uncharacterized protein YjbJ (UPF0337 family)